MIPDTPSPPHARPVAPVATRPDAPPPCLPEGVASAPHVDWTWDVAHKSHEVRLLGAGKTTAQFHPNWSNGTAGVRGTTSLNHGKHYWEIRIDQVNSMIKRTMLRNDITN
jgi:hypothetical protein